MIGLALSLILVAGFPHTPRAPGELTPARPPPPHRIAPFSAGVMERTVISRMQNKTLPAVPIGTFSPARATKKQLAALDGQWSYDATAANGPAHWPKLFGKASGHGACDGKSQSPIDIQTKTVQAFVQARAKTCVQCMCTHAGEAGASGEVRLAEGTDVKQQGPVGPVD